MRRLHRWNYVTSWIHKINNDKQVINSQGLYKNSCEPRYGFFRIRAKTTYPTNSINEHSLITRETARYLNMFHLMWLFCIDLRFRFFVSKANMKENQCLCRSSLLSKDFLSKEVDNRYEKVFIIWDDHVYS